MSEARLDQPVGAVPDARPATPAQLRRQAAREAVVAAARDLIAEVGFGGAQMSLIALRAGVGVGTIYTHFPSRAELFAQVYRDVASHEFERVQAAVAGADGGAAARIRVAVATFCTRALRAGRFAHALLVEHTEPSVAEDRLAFREGYRKLFRDLLEDGVSSGEIPPQDVDTSAAALLGIMTETLVRPLGDGSVADGACGLVGEVVVLCLTAIGASKEAMAQARGQAATPAAKRTRR